MIDDELIESKIDLIFKNLDYLNEISKIDETEFLSSFEKIQASKHSLQEAIESSLDIANHIISSQGWERAETYSDMFERLYEEEVLEKDLNKRLADMARFRNLLVHRYGKIDDRRLFRILNENIDDLHEFVEDIQIYLQQS